jgi:hypothetical protein
MIGRALGLWAALAWTASVSAASSQQLSQQQLQMISDTARDICTSVKDAHGQRSGMQLEGEVHAKLRGLAGKLVDAGGGGKGIVTREEFDGLTQEATATALAGDRDCRERLFNKMFDKLSTTAPPPSRSQASPGYGPSGSPPTPGDFGPRSPPADVIRRFWPPQ